MIPGGDIDFCEPCANDKISQVGNSRLGLRNQFCTAGLSTEVSGKLSEAITKGNTLIILRLYHICCF